MQFIEGIPDGPSALLLEGEAGIGKTILWKEGLGLALARSYRVLSSRPAEAETEFAFTGLGDLLGGVADDVLSVLPEPQARALEVALLRAQPEGRAPNWQAVSVAALGAIRSLAGVRPVLITVDDAHWLDRPSARVLEFAIRRLESDPIGILLTRRVEGEPATPLGLDRALAEERLERIKVGPLSLGALHQLIRSRLGAGFSRPTLLRMRQASGGNPFFALEIARALLRRGGQIDPGQPLPIPTTLSELVRERLARLPARAREALLAASALRQPTVALIEHTVGERVASDLDRAVRAGIVQLDDDRIHFTHPLFASVHYSEMPLAKQRVMHRRLADVVMEPEERARHLALGSEAPDDRVAETLEQAARRARARGAPDAAAELAELACRLTPAGSVDELQRRQTAFADYLFQAGDARRARRVLEELVANMAAGPARARVLSFLANICFDEESAQAAMRLCDQALVEAGGVTSVLAEVHATLAQISEVDTTRGLVHARAALDLLEREENPDTGLVASALMAFAEKEVGSGRGIPMDAMERAIALQQQTEPPPVFWRASTNLGVYLIFIDEFDRARPILEAAHREALEEGDEGSLPNILGSLGELELWTGNWPTALRYGEDCVRLAEQTEQRTVLAVGLFLRGLVEAHLGRVDAARRDAEEGLALGESRGDLWTIGINLWALGFMSLSTGNLADADAYLSRSDAIRESTGLKEPGIWRLYLHQIEPLVGMGQLDRAEVLLHRLEERASASGRPSALATSMRCRGLLLAARGDLTGALAALDAALAEHQRLPMPFELGRTLLVTGQIQRRAKQKRAAQESLERALGIFEGLGAPLWAERTRSELRRVGLRPPASSGLTPTEERVAHLVGTGQTNREVADTMFMSVHTVEANLKRIYRKLGVRSRTELAHVLGGTQGPAQAS